MKHIDDEDAVSVADLGSKMEPKIINTGVTNTLHGSSKLILEAGVYAAIFGSKKPEAKAFKRWVFTEVLPAIRKEGVYTSADREEELRIERMEAIHAKTLEAEIQAKLETIEAAKQSAIETLGKGELLPLTVLLKKYQKPLSAVAFGKIARSKRVQAIYSIGSSVYYTKPYEGYGDSIRVGNTYQLRVYETLFEELYSLVTN